MTRIVLIISALALVVAAPVAAKGPAEATLSGPGLGEGVLLDAESAMQIMETSGFWPATYRQTPNPLLRARPKGDLGPRYRIEYRVLGPNGEIPIAQDVYPFAKGGPVTHVAAGQPLFEQPTTGGWFRAPTSLRHTLALHGVQNAPTKKASKGVSAAWMLAPLAALALAAVPLARRRR
ncbi:MAG TPA: hypothetical protein VE444_06075 [Gaiellaceae bacterium]|jgi:hypothetical protein|nr:hypothetical protein [Gaiellaceae bacterium]